MGIFQQLDQQNREFPVSPWWAFVGYPTNVPAHTEARIQQLCTEALAANELADVDRILPELRSALEEHVRLAKESLEAQVATITSLDAASPTAKGLSKA